MVESLVSCGERETKEKVNVLTSRWENAKIVYFSCCQMRKAIVVKFLLLTVAYWFTAATSAVYDCIPNPRIQPDFKTI